jgi:outer membrane protein TolC
VTVLVVAIATLAAPQARAAAVTAMDVRPDSALAEALRHMEGTPLHLEKAIEAALLEATDVRDAQGALRAAHGAMRRERGAFDPELFADVTRSSSAQSKTSLFDTGLNRQTAVSAGVGVRLPVGTELKASLQTTRFETDALLALLNPEYSTSGKLEVTQPLLKGFGPSAWKDLSGARRDYESARARYDDAVLAMRTQVERVYWDLYAAVRDYGVTLVVRDGAAALVKEAETRARAGIVGPGQVANARVFLAEQEQDALDREEKLDAVSDQLGSLMGRRPEGERVRFLAVDEPPEDFTLEPLDTLLTRAYGQNLVLKAAERDVAAARVRAQGAKWDMLPSLDVFGSIGGNGLAGRGRTVVFAGDTLAADPGLEGGFGDTWARVRNRDFPTWSAGVRLSVPIGFRSGAGEHERLMGELERTEQRYLSTRRTLEEQVRAGYREFSHAQKRVEAARSGADASLEQVRIGLLEFRAGRTTAFELVRLAADVAAAQQRYSDALVRAAKAAADLRRFTSGGGSAGNR